MFLNCGAGEDSKSPLDCKEIKTVNPKGNPSWIFIGRTDAEAEVPILNVKNWLIGKDPDARKDLRQEEKAMTEDEMVGWHQRLKNMSLSKLQKVVMDMEAWRAAVHGVAKNQTWLSDWTELNWCGLRVFNSILFLPEAYARQEFECAYLNNLIFQVI